MAMGPPLSIESLNKIDKEYLPRKKFGELVEGQFYKAEIIKRVCSNEYGEIYVIVSEDFQFFLPKRYTRANILEYVEGRQFKVIGSVDNSHDPGNMSPRVQFQIINVHEEEATKDGKPDENSVDVPDENDQDSSDVQKIDSGVNNSTDISSDEKQEDQITEIVHKVPETTGDDEHEKKIEEEEDEQNEEDEQDEEEEGEEEEEEEGKTEELRYDEIAKVITDDQQKINDVIINIPSEDEETSVDVNISDSPPPRYSDLDAIERVRIDVDDDGHYNNVNDTFEYASDGENEKAPIASSTPF